MAESIPIPSIASFLKRRDASAEDMYQSDHNSVDDFQTRCMNMAGGIKGRFASDMVGKSERTPEK